MAESKKPAPAPAASNPENRIVVLKSAIEKNMEAIRAVATKYVEPERLAKVAIVACSKNPKLLMCSASSVVTAVIQAAELGLDPSGAYGGAHLVPFRSKEGYYVCNLICDYRGLTDIAYRSGAVTYIESRVVYEGEKFLVEYGDSPRLVHVPDLTTDHSKDKPKAFYAVARVKESEYPLIEVMTLAQVNAIRARSRAANDGPWVTDFAQMGRKTVIKRICNYLPRRPSELARALEADNEAEFGIAGLGLDLPPAPAATPEPEPATPPPAPEEGAPPPPTTATQEATAKVQALFPE